MFGQRGTRRIFTIVIRFILVATLIYAGSRIFRFLQLFGKFKDHSGVKLTQDEIYNAHNSSDGRTPMIPKIIHQVFHNWHDANDNTLPAEWQSMRQSCIDMNPGWEHKLWTTQKSRELLQLEFPVFLSDYDSYQYPVQRVDVIKYFVLRQYGGIYIDMDNGCSASLDPLTYYSAFTIDGGQGALSNNIIGGQPDHPFFVLLTDSLRHWNWNYLFPYVTIMFSSGQWYLTAIWEQYHSLLATDGSVKGFKGDSWKPLCRVLNDLRPGADRLIFFKQATGETWADWDYRLLKAVGDHILVIVLLVCCVIAAIWYRARVLGRAHDVENKPVNA